MVSGESVNFGGHLARVTYLPGVKPQSSPQEDTRGRQQENAVPVMTEAPSFAGFYGGDSPGSRAAVKAAAVRAAAVGAAAGTAAGTTASDGTASDGTGTGGTRGTRTVRAENVSMHALTRRGMSRWELEKTLLSRELDSGVVAEELDRLEAVGLIDDAALAETFVRTQHERKGLGRGALIAELRRRHVEQHHIDAALEQVDDDHEQSRATELAIKRADQLRSYDVDTAKRRLHGFLSRKGYSSSVVRAAIDEALSPRSSGVRFR